MELRYKDEVCLVASMHKKEEAIQPSFASHLGCKLILANINTDLLGTFTGEIERKLSPYECVEEKCVRAMTVDNVDLCVANEGSFGPHPYIPFLAADHEIIFFKDRKRGFSLSLSKIFYETNYSCKAVENIEELISFAKDAHFPSHGLIVRSNNRGNSHQMYKGIQTFESLISAFAAVKATKEEKVWVETDMRAHMNPTRMGKIAELAHEMAIRLATPCPACQIPGWGVVKKETGLPCEICDSPTELVRSEIYGCCKCVHREMRPMKDTFAEARYCPSCNP